MSDSLKLVCVLAATCIFSCIAVLFRLSIAYCASTTLRHSCRAGEQVEGKDILEYYRSEKVKTFLKVCDAVLPVRKEQTSKLLT